MINNTTTEEVIDYSGPKINKRNFKKPFCKNFNPTNGFIKVKYLETIDGDTAYFEINGFRESVRFNIVDTPQIYPTAEHLSREAYEYTKSALSQAKEVYLESDIYNNLRDDTLGQRLLAWIWVDNQLLNYNLVRFGYATTKYIISPKMKYVKKLQKAELLAKIKKIGIWQD